MFETGNDIDDLETLCKADSTSKNQKLIEQVMYHYDLLIKKMRGRGKRIVFGIGSRHCAAKKLCKFAD
jgi:hypothetical protein